MYYHFRDSWLWTIGHFHQSLLIEYGQDSLKLKNLINFDLNLGVCTYTTFHWAAARRRSRRRTILLLFERKIEEFSVDCYNKVAYQRFTTVYYLPTIYRAVGRSKNQRGGGHNLPPGWDSQNRTLIRNFAAYNFWWAVNNKSKTSESEV